jgi:hypothetical protein
MIHLNLDATPAIEDTSMGAALAALHDDPYLGQRQTCLCGFGRSYTDRSSQSMRHCDIFAVLSKRGFGIDHAK